ncbi:MAG: DUF3021 domain-containing protein [Lachnospiraceae bacterium]|nr:DUF3021 domain-containing protein [Lachnospiraceae bacterium]
MKKRIIMRGALGMPIGVTIGYFISIFTSFIWAGGYYAPCVPELVSVMGNEINAVMLQAALSGLLGIGFGASSVIWELEDLSIIKQTGIYFLVSSVIMLPSAYFMYWMEHSFMGFLSYFGLFALIFFCIWVVLFFSGKHYVKRMNDSLSQMKHEKDS